MDEQFLNHGYESPFYDSKSGFSQSYLLGRIVRKPKGPRKFYFSFEKTCLTRFGGLSLFRSFCKFRWVLM